MEFCIIDGWIWRSHSVLRYDRSRSRSTVMILVTRTFLTKNSASRPSWHRTWKQICSILLACCVSTQIAKNGFHFFCAHHLRVASRPVWRGLLPFLGKFCCVPTERKPAFSRWNVGVRLLCQCAFTGVIMVHWYLHWTNSSRQIRLDLPIMTMTSLLRTILFGKTGLVGQLENNFSSCV